jgi:hypothetical protein
MFENFEDLRVFGCYVSLASVPECENNCPPHGTHIYALYAWWIHFPQSGALASQLLIEKEPNARPPEKPTNRHGWTCHLRHGSELLSLKSDNGADLVLRGSEFRSFSARLSDAVPTTCPEDLRYLRSICAIREGLFCTCSMRSMRSMRGGFISPGVNMDASIIKTWNTYTA